MEEGVKPVKIRPAKPGPVISRPVFLTILCLFSFVFFGILSIILFLGVFWSGWITQVTNQYDPPENFTKNQILIYLLAGFLLHALSFAGTILIWKLKRSGYYLLGFSCLVMATIQTYQPEVSISTTGVYIILILLFGIFFRRLH